MDFELPDEHLKRRDSVRRLAPDKVEARARAIDKEGLDRGVLAKGPWWD